MDNESGFIYFESAILFSTSCYCRLSTMFVLQWREELHIIH